MLTICNKCDRIEKIVTKYKKNSNMK